MFGAADALLFQLRRLDASGAGRTVASASAPAGRDAQALANTAVCRGASAGDVVKPGGPRMHGLAGTAGYAAVRSARGVVKRPAQDAQARWARRAPRRGRGAGAPGPHGVNHRENVAGIHGLPRLHPNLANRPGDGGSQLIFMASTTTGVSPGATGSPAAAWVRDLAGIGAHTVSAPWLARSHPACGCGVSSSTSMA